MNYKDKFYSIFPHFLENFIPFLQLAENQYFTLYAIFPHFRISKIF